MERFSLKNMSVTQILVVINVVMFLVLMTNGLTPATFYRFGAMFPQVMSQSYEYWRLLTAGFLHANLAHLGMNMISLYMVGHMLEVLYGKRNFLTIYLCSILLGNAMSYSFGSPMSLSLGASGGVYGLFGAVAILTFVFPNHTGIRQQSQTYLYVIAINILYSFSFSNIDIWAHLGGLIGGALVGYLLARYYNDRQQMIVGFLCYTILVIVLVFFIK